MSEVQLGLPSLDCYSMGELWAIVGFIVGIVIGHAFGKPKL